jgi:hypothetical protein|tara:strand:+ start:1292 stop:1420 length:129 start_codon:yes stop_codon:yes gene_type:complete
MTVSRLRAELSHEEFIMFAAYYELKGEKEKQAADRAKHSALR